MIDVLAGEIQFVHHLAPVWHALPARDRGEFIVWPSHNGRLPHDAVLQAADRLGLRPVVEPSDPTRPVLVASYGDHKRARYRRSPIARMEHGIGQSFMFSRHPSYAGGRDARDVGLFLVPNEHAAKRWRMYYRTTRVEVVGCPKLDTLPRREPGPGPVVAVSFHWGTPGRRSHPENESRGSWREYQQAVVDLASHVRLIGTGHPKALHEMAPVFEAAGIPVVEDFGEVLRRADVLVCDTNSALYEFSSTGRMVVVVNGAHFRRQVPHGLRFDWGPCTNVGVQCNAPDQLVSAVERALESRPEDVAARERALDIAYAYRTGGAQRAAAALVDWAGTLERKAA
jgi:hypothetical protein